MLEEANRNLSEAETWRYGEKSSSQEVLINLVQAYKGLLQYYTWSKKKTELSELGESASSAFGRRRDSRAVWTTRTAELIHALRVGGAEPILSLRSGRLLYKILSQARKHASTHAGVTRVS